MNPIDDGPAGAPAPRPKGSGTRRPYHVGVAIGISTCVYTLSLAAVTGIQVNRDRELIADRKPVQDAISLLSHHHDEMDARLAEASDRYRKAIRSYRGVAGGLDELHDGLDRLGKQLSELEGDAVRIPRVTLPGVPRSLPAPAAVPPATHATTGASGRP
jgi:hypothetical protein